MTTTSRRHLRSLCERAIASYIATAKEENTPLLDSDATGTLAGEETAAAAPYDVAIAVSPGQLGEDGTVPAIWGELDPPVVIVGCTRSKPIEQGLDLEVCTVQITVLTSIAEADAPRRQEDRFGFIRSMFGELALEDIVTALNAPAEGPDERTVKGLQVYGIIVHDESSSDSGSLVMDSVTIDVHCAGEDDPAP